MALGHLYDDMGDTHTQVDCHGDALVACGGGKCVSAFAANFMAAQLTGNAGAWSVMNDKGVLLVRCLSALFFTLTRSSNEAEQAVAELDQPVTRLLVMSFTNAGHWGKLACEQLAPPLSFLLARDLGCALRLLSGPAAHDVISRVGWYLGLEEGALSERTVWYLVRVLDGVLFGPAPALQQRVAHAQSQGMLLKLVHVITMCLAPRAERHASREIADATELLPALACNCPSEQAPDAIRGICALVRGMTLVRNESAVGGGVERQIHLVYEASALHCCLSALLRLVPTCPDLGIVFTQSDVDTLRLCCEGQLEVDDNASTLNEKHLSRDVAETAAAVLEACALMDTPAMNDLLAPVLRWMLDQPADASAGASTTCACTRMLAAMAQNLTAGGAPRLTRLLQVGGADSLQGMCAAAVKHSQEMLVSAVASIAQHTADAAAVTSADSDVSDASQEVSLTLRTKVSDCKTWLGILVNIAAGPVNFKTALWEAGVVHVLRAALDDLQKRVHIYIRGLKVPALQHAPSIQLVDEADATAVAAALVVFNLAEPPCKEGLMCSIRDKQLVDILLRLVHDDCEARHDVQYRARAALHRLGESTAWS